ncbi:MAG: hypothetical protein R2830_19375 [Saprospiraceae bacterium]
MGLQQVTDYRVYLLPAVWWLLLQLYRTRKFVLSINGSKVGSS